MPARRAPRRGHRRRVRRAHQGQEAQAAAARHRGPHPRRHRVAARACGSTSPGSPSGSASGERVAFAGQVEIDYGLKQIRAPFVEHVGDPTRPRGAGRVVPVHRTTEGLSTDWMRRLVTEALAAYGDVPDFMPAAVRVRRDLAPLAWTVRAVHEPASMADADGRAPAPRVRGVLLRPDRARAAAPRRRGRAPRRRARRRRPGARRAARGVAVRAHRRPGSAPRRRSSPTWRRRGR